MKYSIKPKNDLDKENAKQLELIMNHKLSLYDNISEVIKLIDNFELNNDINEERLTMESLIEFERECLSIQEPSFEEIRKFSKYYIENYINKDVKIFRNKKIPKNNTKEEKQPKDNHPHGWYRKFDKKRF